MKEQVGELAGGGNGNCGAQLCGTAGGGGSDEQIKLLLDTSEMDKTGPHVITSHDLLAR